MTVNVLDSLSNSKLPSEIRPMHLLIQLEYFDWKSLSESDYETLRIGFPGLPVEKPEYGFYKTLLLNDENKFLLAKYRIPFKISEEDTSSQPIGQMVVKLQDRISQLELKAEKNLAVLEGHGAAVQIHVPDFCLMQVNKVEVLYDACTDALQEMLSDGWRILAVCPPNAQRRPDYILGRRE